MKKLLLTILLLTGLSSVAHATAPLPVSVNQGGTGSTTFTTGQCLVGNGTGPILTAACSSYLNRLSSNHIEPSQPTDYIQGVYFNASTSPGYKISGTTVLSASSSINSTLIGLGAGNESMTGIRLTAVGQGTGASNTTGNNNTFVGNITGTANTTGSANSILGQGAFVTNTTGASNNGIGNNILINNNGDRNNAFGEGALVNNTSGSNNSAFGHQSLANKSTGDYNIGIGYRAGNNLFSGDNNIAIGISSYFPNGSGSNQLNIGNLIYGINVDGQTDSISSGKIGIGSSTPTAKLTVVGQILGEYFTATSTTASSTFGNGLNITGGCYAVNGTCLPTPAAGSGIISLNGLNNTTQTFATTSTTNKGFGFTSSGSVHTLNLQPAGDIATGTMSGYDFQKIENFTNVKQFGAVGDGVTDDTLAIQRAIDYATSTGSGSGMVYFPCGVYEVDGATLQAPGTSAATNKSIFRMPSINVVTTKPQSLTFLGCEPPPISTNWTTDGEPIHTSGTIIKTATVGATSTDSIFGNAGPSGGAEGNINALRVVFKNLTFRTYDNPNITPLNLGWLGEVLIEDVNVDTGTAGSAISQPTHNAYGIIMPYENNWTNEIITHTNVTGYMTSYLFAEHTNADDVNAWNCSYGFELPGSYHTLIVKRSLVVACGIGIRATGNDPGPAHKTNQSFEWGEYATEHATQAGGRTWMNTVYDIYDPNNYLTGWMNYLAVTSFIGTNGGITLNGASNVTIYNQYTNALNNFRLIPTSDGATSGTVFTSAGNKAIQMGTFPGFSSYGGFWFGNTTPSTSNYGFIGDGTSETIFNVPTGGHIQFRINNSSAPSAVTIDQSGNFGIGSSTPLANLQVTSPTANSTTSLQFGRPNQNKGTCLTYYDTAGTPVYSFIPAGATAFTNTLTKPSGCQN